MDYKNTLNLPRTDFPMKADLVAREPQRLAQWQAAGLYERIQAARSAAKEKFVLHDGPPFTNGDVHIGNGLNKILKDMVVKYHSMRGRSAPYIPGWDCHGLPIEFKVSQEMRKAGQTDADPATLRKACEAYARKYIDIQTRQFERLGILGDWQRPYCTLDPAYEADELRLFAGLVEQGFVYRGKKPVYWSIPCRTALAEAEVEYQDHVSQSVYVKFPVLGEPNTFVLIWTTTPWTLPANLAIAYNSTLSYSLVRADNDSYLVSTMRLGQVAETCGFTYEIIRSLDGAQLAQLEFQHPFCARTGKLFAGDAFVENTTGSGFVHIAPGHGLEDYGLGRQNGLPIYSPVDDDGRFCHTKDLPVEQQMPATLLGKAILEKHGKSEANEAVLQLLRERGMLMHQEDYHHSYPHCWRSKTPVIFRAMNQWFIKIGHGLAIADANFGLRYPPGSSKTLRDLALEEIGRVNWIPDWGRTRMEAAVTTRPDWCISRQRSWGVPLPAFYDRDGQPILEGRVVRAAADLVERHGSNVWFEKSAAELWSMLRPEDWTGPEAATKSADTLDVWIDSGSSSRAVLMRRVELRPASFGVPASAGPSTIRADTQPPEGGPPNGWGADMYLEGSDQHRGWFQSSLLLSLAGNGAAPYKTVLTHGFMVDADREKISKSKQTGYEKPQTSDSYVKKSGADIVRLWVTSQDFRNDVVVSDDRINKVGETYRVLRNALRYQLSNLYDFDPAQHLVPDDQLTGLDRWILGEFSKLEQEVMAAYDTYEFHLVYQKVSQFAAVELSAIYHDVVKDRLYTDPANSHRRRSTQTALYRMVTSLCKMLAPILSFTADEAWEFLPGKKEASVHLAEWRPTQFSLSESEVSLWNELIGCREILLPKLELKRQDKTIGKSLDAKLRLWSGAGLFARMAEDSKLQSTYRELVNVSQLELCAERFADEPGELVVHADGQKCERCWHWETDVGSHAEHPTICGRCVEAVKATMAGTS
jgi:isoleucyl-tRNA synthetase